MRLIRGVAGALLWIVSAVLGLVAVILCVTIILLPVGIPLLGYARRLFTLSLKLMLPRAVTRPVETAGKAVREQGRKTADAAKMPKLSRRQTRQARRARKKLRLAS
jgi:hypothetical protein